MTPLIRDFSTLAEIEGSLLKPATAADLDEAQQLWPPVLRRVVAEHIAGGGSPNIKIWQGKWGQKTLLLGQADTSIQGIKAKGQVQGLIKLLVQGQQARLVASKELVYVDLLESAPWNVRRYMNVLQAKPVYKDVGSELMRMAVKESLDRGFGGRVGLHSLPRAETFYDGIGMTRMAPDPDKGGLVYFEFAEDSAKSHYGEKK